MPWRALKLTGMALAMGVLVTLGVACVLIFYGGLAPGTARLAAWIPAGVCGIVSFAVVMLRGYRMGESIADVRRSLRELWDEIGKTPF